MRRRLGGAAVAFNPITLAAVGLLAVGAAALERRLRHPSEFPAGLLVGMAAVLATLALNAAVLLCGGAEDWHTIVLCAVRRSHARSWPWRA